MVVSVLSSLFTSQSEMIKKRIETIQASEKALEELAYQFSSFSKKEAKENVDLQIFDTLIPYSTISYKGKEVETAEEKSTSNSCSLTSYFYSSSSSTSCHEEKEEEKDDLVMHGVYAESNKSSSPSSNYPLVLLHGYQNGAFYFYRNLVGLSQHFPRVYALDMLGWGLSTRVPNFSSLVKTTEQAEHFFVESLEAWRKKHAIDKMILSGHSLGGYISVAYCEKYPQHVERLVLLSPVGVPVKTAEMEKETKERIKSASLPFRMMIGFSRKVWENGVTPAQFLRIFPESRGKSLVLGYIQNRLHVIQDEHEQDTLCDYLYHNAALQPGSGEYCLNLILEPGAYAHKPTVTRIPNLNVSHVGFLYGDRDWMDYKGGFDVKRLCTADNSNNLDKSSPQVQVLSVKDAGHLLMLDNWKDFNNAVIQASTMDYQAMNSNNSNCALSAKEFETRTRDPFEGQEVKFSSRKESSSKTLAVEK